jgi:hypothetical protein
MVTGYARPGPTKDDDGFEYYEMLFGIFLFLQNAPIIWFSAKRQNTVEAATFGSKEFVTLQICTKELIVALCDTSCECSESRLIDPLISLLTIKEL